MGGSLRQERRHYSRLALQRQVQWLQMEFSVVSSQLSVLSFQFWLAGFPLSAVTN